MVININNNNDDNNLPLVLTKSGFASALGTNANIYIQNVQKRLNKKCPKC